MASPMPLGGTAEDFLWAFVGVDVTDVDQVINIVLGR